jgi:hypothetical protein
MSTTHDEQSVFELIQQVTTRRPCANCGRLGFDPNLRTSAAARA